MISVGPKLNRYRPEVRFLFVLFQFDFCFAKCFAFLDWYLREMEHIPATYDNSTSIHSHMMNWIFGRPYSFFAPLALSPSKLHLFLWTCCPLNSQLYFPFSFSSEEFGPGSRASGSNRPDHGDKPMETAMTWRWEPRCVKKPKQCMYYPYPRPVPLLLLQALLVPRNPRKHIYCIHA